MVEAALLATKRRKIVWCSGNSRLSPQLLRPPVWPTAEPNACERVMMMLRDRVGGPIPSQRVLNERLKVIQQTRRGRVTPLTSCLGPMRERLPTVDETGGHELMISDGTVWCYDCALYTRRRQSRQFANECTQVARPSLTALRDGRHPRHSFLFRSAEHVVAEFSSDLRILLIV